MKGIKEFLHSALDYNINLPSTTYICLQFFTRRLRHRHACGKLMHKKDYTRLKSQKPREPRGNRRRRLAQFAQTIYDDDKREETRNPARRNWVTPPGSPDNVSGPYELIIPASVD